MRAGWKIWKARLGLSLSLLAASGCRGCGSFGGGAVSGDTPYVRCLAGPAPKNETRRIGPLSLEIRDRVLTVKGAPSPVRIAALRGPGPGAAPEPPAVAALGATKPDLVVLLGDLGDRDGVARATAAALARLSVPTLFVAGGRDTRERTREALGSVSQGRDRIIDATALIEIRILGDTFVPVAGALDGRYALEDQGCGYSVDDLKRLAKELPAAGSKRRWLLAWQAPGLSGPRGVARTDEGVDVGSAALAQLAVRIGAPGGLFAWPAVQAVRPTAEAGHTRLGTGQPAKDLQLVVPRLTGPALERSDGSRVAPGFVVATLDASGLALEGVHELR